jgi:hypothetical protein
MTTVEHSIDARIQARLAELTTQRNEHQTALTNLQRQMDDHVAKMARCDGRLAEISSVEIRRAGLGSDEADLKWRDFLMSARASMVDELLAIKSPTRDRQTQNLSEDLTFSILLIDRVGSVVTLEPTRIGRLMAADGYATDMPELRGPDGWRGSLPEVERRLAHRARERAAVQIDLGRVLLIDEEYAAREAETETYRTLCNRMRLRLGQDGQRVPHRDDGSVISLEELTPEQAKALAWANTAV